jgi:RNA polymerase sigma-70 factor (sigma-E family)
MGQEEGTLVDCAEDFRRFVLARQRALLRTAWLLTGDWATAEDLVQTALMRAWPHWERVSASDGVDAYVRRIMVNKSLDWRARRWNAEVPTELLPETPTHDRVSPEAHRLLLLAVRSLPPRQRVTIVLRYLDDMSEADTAAAMGCSVGTVKSQSAKALATLRAHPDLADLQLQESAP